jgi:hypothetical protein
MTDEQAADFYAEPANQGFDTGRVVRRRPLASSTPVRFSPEVIASVQVAAGNEGVTVSEWVRNAVTEALARSTNDAADIAKQLEGLARQLRRSA